MDDQVVLSFENPATGEEFGAVRSHTPHEVRSEVDQMRAAYKVWSEKPIEERIRILTQFQGEMLDSLDEITAVMNRDTGKSRQDALAEVFITADVLRAYLKRAPHWLRKRRVSSGIFLFKRAFVEPVPYGVVAVISPWNYPFTLAVMPVLSALLAGNTVVLKPSEVAAATGQMIERLFNRVPDLAPFVRVVYGDGSVGAALVNSRPDFIYLTGSPETGKKVLKAAADYIIPVAAELGGKDALIVLEDADLRQAARWALWGACYNAGQTCMAVERVYVVQEVYDEFLRYALEEAKSLRMGYSEAIDSPYHIGPISDPRQMEIIERHLSDAIKLGARVLSGGKREGNYFEPTVLVDIDQSMAIMQEETFGPVMPVIKVRDVEEAIRLANDSRYGLSASIWTSDIERAKRVASRVEAGSVMINDAIAQFALPMLPFGGMKDSGFGRTHGKEGLLVFTRSKSYVFGTPPKSWDVATIGRNPGKYRLLAAIMHLLFGISPRQRLQPVVSSFEQDPATTRLVGIGLGTVLGILAAVVGLFVGNRRKKMGQL